MNITIEDALELLASPSNYTHRLEWGDRSLIKSLARQVSAGTGLTDRQLLLVLKKIEKYRTVLESQSINVDALVNLTPLRIPLRQIDRSQQIWLAERKGTKHFDICVKFTYSKRICSAWLAVCKQVTGTVRENNGVKTIPYSEGNLLTVISKLQPMGFDIDTTAFNVYTALTEIINTPNDHVPYVDVDSDRLMIKNAHAACESYITSVVSDSATKNIVKYIDVAKQCGIYKKSDAVVQLVNTASISPLSAKVLLEPNTRFRLNPATYTVDDVLLTINEIQQWPLLVVVDEDANAYNLTKELVNKLLNYVPVQLITVFFRLPATIDKHDELSQFVKDNHLNNYINEETKVVFISRAHIPKPLIRSNWKPYAALVTSMHDYGKTSVYLNDFSTVYYYNNSTAVRFNKVTGIKPIAEL